MPEYSSYSLSQHTPNTLNSEQEDNNRRFFNKHSFNIHQENQIDQTTKLNNEAQNWSNNNGNTFQTSIDSILNDTSDFHHTSRHIQSNANNNDFNPLFDFLPSFDDHLILSQQQNTNNSSAAEDTDTTHFNTNNNVMFTYSMIMFW